MSCSTIFYKISRSKLIKKLGKSLENPDTYLSIYEELKGLFTGYKSKKYNDETIKKILDLYLEKKGLSNIDKILEEIEIRKEVKEDNYILLELKQDIEVLNRKMIDLQELVIKSVDDNKNLQKKLMNNVNNHRRIRNKI